MISFRQSPTWTMPGSGAGRITTVWWSSFTTAWATRTNYERILEDTDLLDRIDRGELFSVGRYYLSGQVQIELHPLLQLYTTAIVNLCDPSGVLQPQLVWDVTEDFQAIFGAQWHWGGSGSEYVRRLRGCRRRHDRYAWPRPIDSFSG